MDGKPQELKPEKDRPMPTWIWFEKLKYYLEISNLISFQNFHAKVLICHDATLNSRYMAAFGLFMLFFVVYAWYNVYLAARQSDMIPAVFSLEN